MVDHVDEDVGCVIRNLLKKHVWSSVFISKLKNCSFLKWGLYLAEFLHFGVSNGKPAVFVGNIPRLKGKSMMVFFEMNLNFRKNLYSTKDC